MLSIVRSRNEPAVVELDTSQATFPMMLTPTMYRELGTA